MAEQPGIFQPNPELLTVLLSMGISENAAKEALFCTGNQSADEAINYVFNNALETNVGTSSSVEVQVQVPQGDQPSDESHRLNPEGAEAEGEDDADWEDDDIAYYKMTFVVNSSLKMGVGKIAAQVGHACLGLYRHMLENNMEEDLHHWEEIGEKKIVLKGNNVDHLLELYEKAKEAKIPAYLVRDAGHTQIARGSVTVLSLFGLEENVDKISGGLSLL